MAHNLEMLNGQAQMAYVGETPWHGLGTQVEADITVDGMIKAAGLDWTVTKAPTLSSLLFVKTIISFYRMYLVLGNHVRM